MINKKAQIQSGYLIIAGIVIIGLILFFGIRAIFQPKAISIVYINSSNSNQEIFVPVYNFTINGNETAWIYGNETINPLAIISSNLTTICAHGNISSIPYVAESAIGQFYKSSSDNSCFQILTNTSCGSTNVSAARICICGANNGCETNG